MNNNNLQKFYIFLANVYPIQSTCAVFYLVTEDIRPAFTNSHSDVKIFTLFVNSRKHFVLAFCARCQPQLRKGKSPTGFACIPWGQGLLFSNRLGEP